MKEPIFQNAFFDIISFVIRFTMVILPHQRYLQPCVVVASPRPSIQLEETFSLGSSSQEIDGDAEIMTSLTLAV